MQFQIGYTSVFKENSLITDTETSPQNFIPPKKSQALVHSEIRTEDIF